MYWFEHGEKILPAAVTTVLVMPAILGGLWIGFRLGHKLSKSLFRRITLGLIVLIGLSAILAPLFSKNPF